MTDTIHIVGADGVVQGLRRMTDATEEQRTVVKRLGDKYLAVLRDETPKGRGETPGGLRAGYEDDQAYSATRASYRIRNRVKHLKWVLKGRPRVVAKKRALRFVIDGQVFYRRSVKAAKPNNFPARAREKMQVDIDQARRELPQLIVRSYGGKA